MSKNKYELITSNEFNKKLKKVSKQGKDITKLEYILSVLVNDKELEFKYKDHLLQNYKVYKNARECHIDPDWLLIYDKDENQKIIYLITTGSHSDIFKM